MASEATDGSWSLSWIETQERTSCQRSENEYKRADEERDRDGQLPARRNKSVLIRRRDGKTGKKNRKKKEKKNIPEGIVHIQSTFNNTIITITDLSGNVVAWSSSGTQGFKGSRKSTPFAAQVAAEDAVKKAKEQGMRRVQVYVKGPGSGRESALRSLQVAGLSISLNQGCYSDSP